MWIPARKLPDRLRGGPACDHDGNPYRDAQPHFGARCGSLVAVLMTKELPDGTVIYSSAAPDDMVPIAH